MKSEGYKNCTSNSPWKYTRCQRTDVTRNYFIPLFHKIYRIKLSIRSAITRNNYPRQKNVSITAQISVKGKLKNRKLEEEDNPEVRWS